MIKNIIIGKKSNLSNHLKKEIRNCEVFSIREIARNFSKFNKKIDKLQSYNLILNSFFPSYLFKNLKNKKEYKKISIEINKKILKKINQKKINKIILSSSASVYYFNKASTIKNEKLFYSKAKYDLENFLLLLFKNNKKKIIIARIFNMYGGNDKFSIISKLIQCYKKKRFLILNNKGNTKRDFIHVKDVAKIYSRLLESDLYGIYDIGTGKSTKIYDLIKRLKISNFRIKHGFIKEEKISIAKIKKRYKKTFISKIYVKNFLKLKLNLK